MMKIAMAALMAGAAQAKPLNMGPSSINAASFTTLTRPTSTGSSMMQESTSSSSSSSGSSNGSQTTGSGFPSFVSSTIDATAAAQLAKQLDADLTQVDVLQELLSVNHDVKNLVPITDPEDVHDQLTFDFKTAPVGGDGGRILVANEKNFPFLVSSKSDGSNGISGAVAFLEPCGMNSPHTL